VTLLGGGIIEQTNITNAVTYADDTGYGQTMIDTYRHGKYPKVSSSSPSKFSKQGGKVMFNVLYCDGPAPGVSDQAEAFRALRLRYPG